MVRISSFFLKKTKDGDWSNGQKEFADPIPSGFMLVQVNLTIAGTLHQNAFHKNSGLYNCLFQNQSLSLIFVLNDALLNVQSMPINPKVPSKKVHCLYRRVACVLIVQI